MFKKLASLLFEEEEVTEEEEEKVELKRVKKQAEPIKAEVRVPVFNDEPIEKPRKRSFEDIVADEGEPKNIEAVKPAPIDEKKEPVRPSEPAFIDRKPDYSKEVYEFKPVISPMFGIAESEKEHIRPTFVQTAEVKNDSHLQTVISPYYGAIHKDMKTGPDHPEPIVIEPAAPVKAKVAQYVEEAKAPVIENIALEDLIQPNEIELAVDAQSPQEEMKSEEKAEDVTQFSLFGDE